VNLVLLQDDDFTDVGRVRLTGRRLQHLLEVNRVTVGTRLRAGVLNGAMGTGRVTAVGPDRVELEVTLDRQPPPPLPATLLLALPRPKVLRRVLQATSAMGIKRIFFINTWRVEKSFWKSPVTDPAALREELLLGLEQGCDTVLPEVSLRRLFKPFAEDELPTLVKETLALVAHPTAARPCPRAVDGPVILAVGPEGGFIPYEIDALSACGFHPVSLGPRILRVEHVVPTLLGRLL
jgi:16S rRNA (uracil1498-N3)-methyltransferase